MSRNTYPTRRTRIHPKGQQAPLEGRAHPTGTRGRIKAPFAGTTCSTPFLKPLLFKHRREAHSPECVEGVFYEIRLGGILGRALRAVRRGNESVYTPLSPSRRPKEEPCRK